MFCIFYLIGVAISAILLYLFVKDDSRLSISEKFVIVLVCLPFSWFNLLFIGIIYSAKQ